PRSAATSSGYGPRVDRLNIAAVEDDVRLNFPPGAIRPLTRLILGFHRSYSSPSIRMAQTFSGVTRMFAVVESAFMMSVKSFEAPSVPPPGHRRRMVATRSGGVSEGVLVRARIRRYGMDQHSPSPALFFDTIGAYQRTEALRAAIELDFFTLVADGQRTAA